MEEKEKKEEIELEKYNAKSWANSAISGFLIGLAVILPGISGSTIAIIFKIYDKMLFAVSNIFKKFVNSIIYLLPILIGAIFGFVIGFFVVQSVIETCTFIVVSIFGGLMLGASPEIYDEIRDVKPKPYQIVLLILGLIIPITLSATFAHVQALNLSDAFNVFPWRLHLVAFFSGILVSLTQLIPGLSATVLLMSLGLFKPIMDAIHFDVLMNQPLWFLFLGMLALGFLVGFFLFSKIMSHFFSEHRKSTYFLIMGLTISSIIAVFYNSELVEVYNMWAMGEGNITLDLGLGIPLFIVGTIIAYLLVRYQRKKSKEINIKENSVQN